MPYLFWYRCAGMYTEKVIKLVNNHKSVWKVSLISRTMANVYFLPVLHQMYLGQLDLIQCHILYLLSISTSS